MFKNKILFIIYCFVSIFYFHCAASATEEENDGVLVSYRDSNSKTGNEICTVKAHKKYHTIPKRNHTWTWLGVGFNFTNSALQEYIQAPTMDYQLGVGQSFFTFRPRSFLYVGIIADFARSQKFLRSAAAFKYDALYFAANEQLVLGYEENLGTPYLSAFLEAGGAFQQRYFGIVETTTASMLDFILANTFGGTFNGGFNIRFPNTQGVSFLLRIAMNLMIGGAAVKTLDYNGQSVNANQMIYGPSISFGVNW